MNLTSWFHPGLLRLLGHVFSHRARPSGRPPGRPDVRHTPGHLDTEALINSLSEAVIVLNPLDELQYANHAWHVLVDSHDPVIGQRLTDYIHPEDRLHWRQRLTPLTLVGMPDIQTACLRITPQETTSTAEPSSHHNDTRWFEIRLQAMPGQPGLTSATLCDVHHQVHSEQQKAAHHRGLSDMVDRLPVMVYRSRNDRDWTMEYISEGCYEVTGYEAADIVELRKHAYGSLIHPDDAGRVWEQVQEALHLQRSFEIEYRLFHRDGHLRHVIEKGCGVYTNNGAILAVEGVIFAHDPFTRQHDEAPSPLSL